MEKRHYIMIVGVLLLGAAIYAWTVLVGGTGGLGDAQDTTGESYVPSAVAAVQSFAAAEFQVPVSEVRIIETREDEWDDRCLDLPIKDERCPQTTVPGFRVKVFADGAERIYRVNIDGTTIRKE